MKANLKNSNLLAAIIEIMFSAYGKSDDQKRQFIYIVALEGLPAELINAAIHNLLITNKFLPSISEIFESAKSINECINGSNYPSWDEALTEITNAMQKYGQYNIPLFSSPAIAYVVHTYGWIDLCSMTDVQKPIVYAQLRNLYEQYCKRKTNQYTIQFVLSQQPLGYLHCTQSSNGDLISVPKLINEFLGGKNHER